MAAYIPVPRDLTRVKTKVFFNLTKRQLLCFGAAALIGVPIFFLVKATGNVSLAALSMMIIKCKICQGRRTTRRQTSKHIESSIKCSHDKKHMATFFT